MIPWSIAGLCLTTGFLFGFHFSEFLYRRLERAKRRIMEQNK